MFGVILAASHPHRAIGKDARVVAVVGRRLRGADGAGIDVRTRTVSGRR
jgi:hypothetical protein